MPSLRVGRKSFLLARKERKKKKKEKGESQRVVFLPRASSLFLLWLLPTRAAPLGPTVFSSSGFPFFFGLLFFPSRLFSDTRNLPLPSSGRRTLLVTHTLRVFRIAIEQYNHNYSGLLVLSVLCG